MANGGAQLTLRLSPLLTVESIVPIRVYPTYKERLVFDPTFECEVLMQGHCHRVDLEEKKLSIGWHVSCASSPGQRPVILSREDAEAAPREPIDYTVGVYGVDLYLTDDAGNAFSYDPAKSMGIDKFETVHGMQALGRFPEQLDSYTLQLFAFAINPASNLSVDIIQFSVPGSPNGFTLSSDATDVMKELEYDTGNDSEITRVRSRALTITLRYSTFTLVLTACMFIANWVLTIASLCITSYAMKTGGVTWSALILHNTMALVIPSIRKLYFFPPPFGVFLDTAGFFLQGAIISLCSLVLLRALVVQPTLDKKTLCRVG